MGWRRRDFFVRCARAREREREREEFRFWRKKIASREEKKKKTSLLFPTVSLAFRRHGLSDPQDLSTPRTLSRARGVSKKPCARILVSQVGRGQRRRRRIEPSSPAAASRAASSHPALPLQTAPAPAAASPLPATPCLLRAQNTRPKLARGSGRTHRAA